MPKQKFRHEIGMIVPQTAKDEKEAHERLSFLKQVMIATIKHQCSALQKMKIVKKKFILHAPSNGSVLPLFTGHFKIEHDAPDQPSALPIIDEEEVVDE